MGTNSMKATQKEVCNLEERNTKRTQKERNSSKQFHSTFSLPQTRTQE
jgi:hypothetical protein